MSYICHFLDLIFTIPDVIWSAVIASFLTFLGVMWTNKGNEERQIALLKHEKEKFQSEQKLALKKDVFLEVAGSFSNVLNVFPKLMNLDFTEKQIMEQIGEHSAIVAKSYLAAHENTVAEILKYSSEVSEAFIELTVLRAILLDHKKAIEIYQDMIIEANEEKNRVLSLIREFNLQGRTEKLIFDYLNENYEFQEKTVQKGNDSIAEQKQLLEPLHKEFCRRCITEHSRLLSLLPSMTIAIRKELDNNQQSQIFVEALEESIVRMRAAFDKLLSE